MTMKKMGVIVAIDKCNGIGKGGALPWHLRKDMAHFVNITTETDDPTKINAVIMGRRCWESIPEKFRPLKNRLNVVISRTLKETNEPPLIITSDFDKIVSNLFDGPLSQRVETVWNIGGAEVYRLALEKNVVDRLVITRIDKDFNADVKLSVPWQNFELQSSSEIVQENDAQFRFEEYRLIENS